MTTPLAKTTPYFRAKSRHSRRLDVDVLDLNLSNMYCSDNGTNFVGASGILKDEFSNIRSDKEQSKIYNQLRQKGVTWHFNPLLASHAGGVWERIIRSIKRILTALTTEQTLDDETLSTLLEEVERILNDRPLLRGEGQVDDLDPLMPSKLLLLRSNSCLPLGVFVGAGRFGRRWRPTSIPGPSR